MTSRRRARGIRSFGGSNGVWWGRSQRASSSSSSTDDVNDDTARSSRISAETEAPAPFVATGVCIDGAAVRRRDIGTLANGERLIDGDEEGDVRVFESAIATTATSSSSPSTLGTGHATFIPLRKRRRGNFQTFAKPFRPSLFMDTKDESPLAVPMDLSRDKSSTLTSQAEDAQIRKADEIQTLSNRADNGCDSNANTRKAPQTTRNKRKPNARKSTQSKANKSESPNTATTTASTPAVIRNPSHKSSPRTIKTYFDHLDATEQLNIEMQSPSWDNRSSPPHPKPSQVHATTTAPRHLNLNLKAQTLPRRAHTSVGHGQQRSNDASASHVPASKSDG